MNRWNTALVTFTLAVNVAFVMPAAASDQSDVEAAVTKWIDDFNKGETKSFFAACAPHIAIIDDFPPYAWTTCKDWIKQNNTSSKEQQASGGSVSLGAPSAFEVQGDLAYTVYPATYSSGNGKFHAVQKGSWTLTLHKSHGRWLFTGAAWTDQ